MAAQFKWKISFLDKNLSVEIITVKADEAHLPALITLGSTHYSPGHPALSENFLRWFYLDNPYGCATLIVAQENDLWIGLIVLIPIVLEGAGGRLQNACYAVNVLTHPQHRGKSLFTKMISHARNLLSASEVWLLGHPNSNATPGWQRQKMEFREPLNLHFIKPRLPFSAIREMRLTSLHDLQTIPESFWTGLRNRTDTHLKYTPEFVAWRFLSAPHRKYKVSAVTRKGVLLGIRVTRSFKGPIDLMVDFIGPVASLGDLFSSRCKPTLVMHAGCGNTVDEVKRGSWRIPVRRKIPFFVTTWGHADKSDMTGITLAASDF